jgi:hypothetical protein
MDDELLPVLLKLVQGNKELCFELIKAVRERHPDKPLHWCIQKAIYDARYPKKQVTPNPTLNRWSQGETVPTKPLPPPPPPNPTLSKPKTERWGVHGVKLKAASPIPQTVSASTVETVARAKARGMNLQPANGVTKLRLDRLTKDAQVSERLVQRLLLLHPDKSEQWAYEKAIYDMERDRL